MIEFSLLSNITDAYSRPQHTKKPTNIHIHGLARQDAGQKHAINRIWSMSTLVFGSIFSEHYATVFFLTKIMSTTYMYLKTTARLLVILLGCGDVY